MDNVLEKARELGQSIQESSILKDLRIAEALVQQDADASRLLDEYNRACGQLRERMGGGADSVEISRLSSEVRELGDLMQNCKPIQALIEIESSFQAMMEQVNSVIRFFVTGETDAPSGCAGSCAGCGGGCAH